MSDEVKISIVNGLVTAVPIILSIIVARWHSSREHRVTADKVKQIEANTNSMKDALVAAEKVISHAEGMAEQKELATRGESVENKP